MADDKETEGPKGGLSMGSRFSSPATTFSFGVDGKTGSYFRPPRAQGDFAWRAQHHKVVVGGGRDPRANIDPDDLSSAGWGVVWSDEETREQVAPLLAPLLEKRRAEAVERYVEYVLEPEPDARAFLDGTGGTPGPPDPESSAPYYLTLVGPPERVSFEFQQELDLRYAVGRLYFEHPESYRRYAEAVVYAEQHGLRQRRMSLFGARHKDDPVTQACVEQLITPLAAEVAGRSGWTSEMVLDKAANRDALQRLLAPTSRSSILLTAAHSPVLDADDPLQKNFHGGVVTSEWTGPASKAPVGPEHVFAATDVDPTADLRGLVAILVGCFSAGTPRFDAFREGEPLELTAAPYVARLPQALLDRGALAVVAHVDSLYLHSFAWPGAGRQAQHQTYGDMIYRLGSGHRLGLAMDTFGRRYAELAAHLLAARLEPGRVNATAYSAYWIGYHDARQYVVLGDPAVQLSLETANGAGDGEGA